MTAGASDRPAARTWRRSRGAIGRGVISRGVLGAALLAAACLPGDAWADSAPPLLEVSAPPGFEALEQPQTMIVDVYFGDETLGVTQLQAAPGRVLLDDPAAVLALLPALRPGAEAAVLQSLSGELETHAGLSCSPRWRQGCGSLQPEVAGVIFDDAILRLSVFVNPELLAVDGDGTAPRHLPPSSAESLAFYNPFAAYYSGYFPDSGGSEQDFSALSDSYLSFGPNSLHVGTSYLSEQVLLSDGEDRSGFALDDASLMHVQPGWLFEGGLFRTSPLSLVGSERFIGLGAVTTTATRIDLDRAQGSTLVVFLPSRSTVDLVVNGRTVSRRSYPAGNQALDTTGLPDGAYDVTIRVRDEGGSLTEETRFFAKSNTVPLADEPTYVLQAGVLVEESRRALPRPEGTPVLRAGTAHRLTDDLALGGNLLATRDLAVGTLEVDYFSSLGVFSGALLGSSDGDFGISASLYGSVGDLAYSLSGQMLERQQEPDAFGPDFDEDFLGPSYRQLSLSLSYPLAESLDLTLRGFWREDLYDDGTYLVGPRLTWRLYQSPWLNVSLDAEVTKTQDETYGLVQFRLFHAAGEDERWSFSETAGVLAASEFGDQDTYDRRLNPYGSAQAQWSDGDLLADDLRLRATALYDTSGDTGGAFDFEHASDWGLASGEVRRTWFDGSDGTTSLQAGISSALALDGGGLAFGGAETAGAAVTILLQADDDTVLYDVLVNGQRKLTLRGGGSSLLPLPPYHSYRIALRPQAGSAVTGGLDEKRVTLYPGNSVTLTWELHRVVAVFGRALDTAGQPLANARVTGGEDPAFTDSEGYFQVDVRSGAPLTLNLAGAACRLDLPDLPEGGDLADYVNVGNRTCS